VLVLAFGETAAEEPLAAEVEALARAAVIGRGEEPVDAFAPSRLPEAVLREALTLVERGELAYAELDAERASVALEEAVDLLGADLDRLPEEGRAPLLRALTLLGSVHNQAGDPERAREAFLTLLALAPAHELEEGAWPPSDVELFRDLQEELAFSEPGALKLSSDGPPGAVFVDGRLRGVTPLEVGALGPGRHLFLVKRQGNAPASGRVLVGGEEPRDLRVSLGASLPGLQQQALAILASPAGPAPHALTDLAARAAAPADVLVLLVVDKGARLRLVRAAPGPGLVAPARELALEGEWREALAGAVGALLDEPLQGARLVETALTSEEEGGGGLWIASAAGAGALVTAVLTGAVVSLVLASRSAAGAGPPAPSDEVHAQARRRVVLGF
jgi:tetratricopeptide (TPR) repeat protein